MDPMIGGSLILAGSSLAGGVMNKLFDNSDKINAQNYANQKEFAQNSIQWRVNDAKKAGIHPLAALGTQGSYYTPSAQTSSNNYGDMVANVGGQIGSALMQKSLMLDIKQKQANIAKTNAETANIAGQNSAQMPVATPTLQEVTKTNRGFAKDVSSGKHTSYLSEKSAPNHQINPISKGKLDFGFREGSSGSEAWSEANYFNKMLATGQVLKKDAWRFANDLNKADPKADWFVTQDLDGTPKLINRNDNVEWGQSNIFDKADYYIGKAWNKIFN